MPDLTKLLAAIDKAAEFSYGGDEGDEIANDRALALDYYYGRNIEQAPEGRSQVVDRSVFETVQWILPALCRIFANGDNVVELVPFGPEDEESAKQESDYLNYLVTQRNPWFQVFLDWAQDALLLKNGYCMPYIEERVQVETETYKDQSEEQVALLIQDGAELVEIEPGQSDDGMPVYTATIRRSKPEKKLCFQVLPPERCKVGENTPSFSLRQADYFEYADDMTISALREMGYQVEDDISDSESPDNETDRARDIYSEESGERTEHYDPVMRTVRVRMIWIRYDYDEDGIAELQRVMRVGQEVLKYEDGRPAIEQLNRINVACIVPTVNPHRHPGTSVADMVMDIQRIATAVLRQGLDSLYQSNSPRHAISDKVNLDDMSVTAPGWNVRLNDGAIPGEGHILPLVTPFVFPQALEGLNYLDQVKEKRTGSSRYTSGIDADVQSKSPSGVAINQVSTMAAQRIEQIARIIASGVEELFSLAHELVLKSGHKADTVKLRGKWVTVDPASWRSGRDMRIVVGYGAGNKDALMNRLMVLAGMQEKARAGGLKIVTQSNLYETAIEMTKAADFTAPQRFWTDPATVPDPPPQPSEAQIYAQVEAAKMQSAEKIKGAELEQKNQSDVLAAEVDILLEQIKAGNTVDVERFRANTKSQSEAAKPDKVGAALKEIAQAVESVQASFNAPREIIRDKAGKPVGVRVNGVDKPLKRDGQGRVSGV